MMGYTAAFDYNKMAREAARERDVLHARLQERKCLRPKNRDEELRWKQENSILYAMYLEQRCQADLLARRARERHAQAGQAVWEYYPGKEAKKTYGRR